MVKKKKKVQKAAGPDTGSAGNMSEVYPTSATLVARANWRHWKCQNQYVGGDNNIFVTSRHK